MAGRDGHRHWAILRRVGNRFTDRIARTRREGIVVAALVLLAAVQAAVIGNRLLTDRARPHDIVVGDDLSKVPLRRADGSLVGLGGGRTTLLLVYDPDCAHSDRVAAGWQEWLDRRDRGADRILALHAGSRSLAVAYAVGQRWPVEVVSVGSAVDGSRAWALTRRTPWVFAIGGDGVVVASGHGRELPQLARALIPTHSSGTLAGQPSGPGPSPPGRLARRTGSDRTASERVP